MRSWLKSLFAKKDIKPKYLTREELEAKAEEIALCAKEVIQDIWIRAVDDAEIIAAIRWDDDYEPEQQTVNVLMFPDGSEKGGRLMTYLDGKMLHTYKARELAIVACARLIQSYDAMQERRYRAMTWEQRKEDEKKDPFWQKLNGKEATA